MNLNKKVCEIRSSLYLHKFSRNIIMSKDKITDSTGSNDKCLKTEKGLYNSRRMRS